MKKLAASKQTRHTKRRFILVGLLVVALGLAAWITMAKIEHTRAVNQERQEFAQAEKDLDNMSATIVTKFGKPEQEVKSKNCGYTSNPNEFEKGDLVCSLAVRVVYTANSEQALQSSQNIEESLSANTRFYDTSWASTEALNEHSPITVGSTSFGNFKDIACNVEYDYYAAQDAELYGYPAISPASSGLMVSLDCSARPAKAQYFPLTD